MLFLAIIATLGAIVWSVFVVSANGMASAPMAKFQGMWSIGAAWAAAVVFWIAWACAPNGATTNAFARVPGCVIDTGLLSYNLVAETPAGLFIVGVGLSASPAPWPSN